MEKEELIRRARALDISDEDIEAMTTTLQGGYDDSFLRDVVEMEEGWSTQIPPRPLPLRPDRRSPKAGV
jgi:hypothetical protein